MLYFFLSGDSPAFEFYVPTFRNTLFRRHELYEQEELLSYLTPLRPET